MLLRLSLFLLLLSPMFAPGLLAQKEYNIWYFGNKAGITFNTTPPLPLTDGQLETWNTTSGICDADGNMLFYCANDSVFNRDHRPMKNGGHEFIWDAGQTPLVLPVPGQPGLYYIFHNTETNFFFHFSCSVVNISGDSGRGEVSLKGFPLMNSMQSVLGAGMHANNFDYWLLTAYLNSIVTMRSTNGWIDTNSLVQHGVQALGMPTNSGVTGITISPNNSLVAMSFVSTTTTYPLSTSYLGIFHFDNATGTLSNPIFLNMGSDTGTASKKLETWISNSCFSPDSRSLYITLDTFIDNSSSFFSSKLLQLDLSAGSAAAVLSSATLLSERVNVIAPTGDGVWFSKIQTGPDGKIYVFDRASHYVHVIHKPNQPGLACNFEDSILFLQGRTNGSHGPNYANLHPGKRLSPDTILCEGEVMTLDSRAANGQQVIWSTGDTTPVITIDTGGMYWVKVQTWLGQATDTVHVQYGKKPKVYIGADTAFCNAFTHVLNAGPGKKEYKWNTGDSNMVLLVNKAGEYSVIVKDSFSCLNRDTIGIEQLLLNNVHLSYDSLNCDYVALYVSPVQAGVKYKWSTGDSSSFIRVKQKAVYTLTASNPFCSITQSINVKLLPVPEPELGPDTNLCEKEFILLKGNDGDAYVWSTGHTSQSIYVYEAGTYWVTATRNHCSQSDTIVVGPNCEGIFHIPSAFSPNGDGVNDIFTITGVNIDHMDMKIYDRWGEEIFHDAGKTVSWDGSYKGQSCAQDVYVYVLSITAQNKNGRKHYPSGTLTLLK